MTDRRTFIGGAMASALAGCDWSRAFRSPAVGGRWAGWRPGEYQVHFIYTGRSESSFHIFPDGTSMLLDCGTANRKRNEYTLPSAPDATREPGEQVARYVHKVNPNGDRVDYMMSSHWHVDHVGADAPDYVAPGVSPIGCGRSGFGQAAEFLHFGKAIDRSWPDFDDPVPIATRETAHIRKVYEALRRRDGLAVEKFRLGATDQIVPLHGSAPGFACRNVCANGRIALPDGTARDVLKEHIAERNAVGKKTRIDENTLSLGMIVSYGCFRFFTAGDALGRFFEEALADAVEHCHVSKTNHHTHVSMPPRLVQKLASRYWITLVWDSRQSMPSVMRTLADKTLYPGDRTIIPCFMPPDRRSADAGEAWLKDVPAAVFEPCHVVLSVAEGGESYTVSCLGALEDNFIVRAQFAERIA